MDLRTMKLPRTIYMLSAEAIWNIQMQNNMYPYGFLLRSDSSQAVQHCGLHGLSITECNAPRLSLVLFYALTYKMYKLIFTV